MKKKYQCFISSTFTDLVQERDKVFNVIHKIKHIPVGMECFNAANESQWTTITRIIDSSDYYILIVGHRYGSISERDGISYTEKEYRYAKSKCMPILSFIRKRDASVSGNFVDGGVEKEKLDNFISDISSDTICDFWSAADELATKVSAALHEAFENYPRPGWIRWSQHLEDREEEIISLLKKNRELEEELTKKSAKIYSQEDRTPKFEMWFGDSLDTNFVINTYNFDYSKQIDKIGVIHKITNIPQHLQEHIDQFSIDEYNDSIERVNYEIEAYNNKLEQYNRNIFCIDIPISICNEGKSIANNIFIELDFPDDFVLHHNIFDEKIKVPKRPKIPANPVEQAESKYRRSKRAPHVLEAVSFAQQFGIHSSMLSIPGFPKIGALQRSPLSCRDDNSVTIELTSLLHTRMMTITDLAVIPPLQKRTYTIAATIICKELIEPQHFELTIEVL